MPTRKPHFWTRRHFRPASKISRIFPIVCGGAELKNSNYKKKTCFELLNFSILESNFQTPCVKKQGLSNAQFRTEIASELCVRLPLFFYTWVTQINSITGSYNYSLHIHIMLHFIFIWYNKIYYHKYVFIYSFILYVYV